MLLYNGYAVRKKKKVEEYNCMVFRAHYDIIIISGYLSGYLLLFFTTKQMQEHFDLTLFLSGHYSKLYTYSM